MRQGTKRSEKGVKELYQKEEFLDEGQEDKKKRASTE